MPVNLVTRAIEQSATREMMVRAMALLSSARVLVTGDKKAAKQAYSEGVAIAQSVPLSARHRGLLLEEAVRNLSRVLRHLPA